MADWKSRSNIELDVVFFSYNKEGVATSDYSYLWDLDKTYLDTKFETVKGLFRTVFEKAFEKKNIPGTSELVSSIKKFNSKTSESFPLFFITASPPQLEKKIREKLVLDEIEPAGLFCKDNIQNLHPKKLWRLKKQIGYKLHALMLLRTKLSDNVQQFLWGDDSEADAIIYSLYSDICARRRSRLEFTKLLAEYHVTDNQIKKIMDLQGSVPEQDPVGRYYINLEEDTDAEYYVKFGRRCLPTYNSFQSALDLYQLGRLDSEHIIDVGSSMLKNYNFTTDEIEKCIEDLVRRKIIGQDALSEVLPKLQENGLIHNYYEPSIEPVQVSWAEGELVFEGVSDPWVPERIDYLHDYR